MIQIEEIRIQEFRGIRDLRLKLGSNSFVVWGPNGSGKSGVVDAIDFALTGDISRLGGAGSGGLSVLKHGPHVHKRDDPGSSQVSMTVRDTTSGKMAVLTRCVKTAGKYTLEPDLVEVHAALALVQRHGELTLSRREIIKFVLTEPGKRSQEVQALLRLGRLGEIRSVFKTVQTKTSNAEKVAQGVVETAEGALRRHLELSTLLDSEIISVVNKHRSVLGLMSIERLDDHIDLRQDVDADSSLSTFNRASAVRDVAALTDMISNPEVLLIATRRLKETLDVLEANPNILSLLHQRELITAGANLISEAKCPLCDLEWPDADALRTHLAEKLTRLKEAAELEERIAAASLATIGAIQSARELVRAVEPFAASDGMGDLQTRLQLWSDDLVSFETKLGSTRNVMGQRLRLAKDPLGIPDGVATSLLTLLRTLQAKPDQTATAIARTFLIVAQERWSAVRYARAELRKRAAAQAAARVTYDTYCLVSDAALTDLYNTVEEEFSRYYGEINSDDESAFKAQLEPSAGKLELSVDFHGLGMFPPAAYHSEGHQDSMGVCLYLALIKQLLGTDFRLAVLDDVVMSVDSNHRKQFCNLLRTHFPDVQFIITTHDEVWARQMQSTGLVSKAAQVRFYGWTVDNGPTYEEARDFWDRIDSDLANDDVPPAAAHLRRNLESIMAELASSLRGQVTYRANGNYDLGEFLSSVKGRHGKLLSLAAKSANSWGNEEAKARVEDIKSTRTAAILAQEDENWAINPAVHFNEWAAFSKADFIPVVTAWKQFLALFSCGDPACGSWIYVVGSSGHEEALRCRCGSFNLNLRSK